MDSENQQICRDFVRPVILPLLNCQPPEKQAFRGVCPHPGLILCTLLPLLGTLPTTATPCFLSKPAIANIVGYNTITIEKKNTILAVQFQSVTGGDISIQDAFPAQEGMTQGAASTAADQIQIQNAAGGYDTYFLSNGKNARGQDLPNVDAGDWVKASASTVKATATLTAGQAFWYIAKDSTTPYTVNVAGQVLEDDYIDLEIVKKNQHIGCPYPCDMPITNIVTVSGCTQGAASTAADQIQVQNAAGGYDTYFLSNGKNARGQDLPNVDPGDWVKASASTVKATGFIPVGKGAWFIRKGDDTATIRFNKPF